MVEDSGKTVLGRDTNGREIEVELKVGALVTVNVGTDRYASEVVAVSRSGRVVDLKDFGRFSRRKNGRWAPVGHKGHNSGYSLLFGQATDYRDPHF